MEHAMPPGSPSCGVKCCFAAPLAGVVSQSRSVTILEGRSTKGTKWIPRVKITVHTMASLHRSSPKSFRRTPGKNEVDRERERGEREEREGCSGLSVFGLERCA